MAVVGCAGCYACASVSCHPGERADLQLRALRGSSFVNLHQSLSSVSSVPPDLRPRPTPSWPRVSKLSVWGPEPRLRDAETGVWPGDAVSASSPLMRLFFSNPGLHLFFSLFHFFHGILYLLFLTHPALSPGHIRPLALPPSSRYKVSSSISLLVAEQSVAELRLQ